MISSINQAANSPSAISSTPLDELITNRIDQLSSAFDIPLELLGVMRVVYETGLQDAQVTLGVLISAERR